MRVLADYHHHDLWESLELLCARLGWDLYRPIGMDWFDAEYWNFERAWHGDSVAKQYLMPWDGDTPIVMDDGTKYPGLRYDPSHGRLQKMLTLEAARDIGVDIVIASVAHNHEGFARFASEVRAKFGIHLGNVRYSAADMKEDRWDLADFGIVTSILPIEPPKPHVIVHQEFSLQDFRHEPALPNRGVDNPMRVASFVNCFPETPTYPGWTMVAGSRPQYDWRVYGAYGSAPTDEYAAGNLDKCAAVGDAMRASDVAWHTKVWSDGFGHVIHNWFAVGRPVVGHEFYYKGGVLPNGNVYLPQLAGPLWQEGVTSFDLTDKAPDEVAGIIDRLYNDPDLRLRMGENAAARFREVVDFDEEEQAIRRMFEAVL